MAALWTALLVIVTDQMTKCWIRHAFRETESLVVIRNLFNITYIRNRGGAFGIFQHQQILFVILSVVAVAAIIYFYRKYTPKRVVCKIAAGLILGGAIGNLLDRLLLDGNGCVTDWLDFHLGPYHWPAFNIADGSICIGVFLMIYYLVIKAEQTKSQKPETRDQKLY